MPFDKSEGFVKATLLLSGAMSTAASPATLECWVRNWIPVMNVDKHNPPANRI